MNAALAAGRRLVCPLPAARLDAPASAPPGAPRSARVAYALWCCGGLVGLHHVYLGRTLHAMVAGCSLGGLGLGALRDLYRMRAYVAAANGEPASPRCGEGAAINHAMAALGAAVSVAWVAATLARELAPATSALARVWLSAACGGLALVGTANAATHEGVAALSLIHI